MQLIDFLALALDSRQRVGWGRTDVITGGTRESSGRSRGEQRTLKSGISLTEIPPANSSSAGRKNERSYEGQRMNLGLAAILLLAAESPPSGESQESEAG